MVLPFRGLRCFINPASTSASSIAFEVPLTNETQLSFCLENKIPIVQRSERQKVARIYLASKNDANKGLTKERIDRAYKLAKSLHNLGR